MNSSLITTVTGITNSRFADFLADQFAPIDVNTRICSLKTSGAANVNLRFGFPWNNDECVVKFSAGGFAAASPNEVPVFIPRQFSNERGSLAGVALRQSTNGGMSVQQVHHLAAGDDMTVPADVVTYTAGEEPLSMAISELDGVNEPDLASRTKSLMTSQPC